MGNRVSTQSEPSLTTPSDCRTQTILAIALRTRTRLLFVAAAGVLVLGLWMQRHFFHDDAYVPLRYIERLFTGHGLTWNDGERVEGFSSPCWLAQVAILGYIGVPLPWAARMLGVAYALSILVLWYRVKAEPLGLLVFITIPGFAIWAWGGLETIATCFWILVALHLVQRIREQQGTPGSGLLLGFSLAAIVLTRPEGAAVGLMLLFAVWPAHCKRHTWIATGCFVVAVVGYEIFRLAYFGDWIANGARAKTLGLPLGARFESAAVYLVKTAPQWLGAMFVAAWMLAWSRPRVHWLLLPMVPLLLVVILAGGDHMLGARFMLAPIAVLCFAASLARPSPRRWVRSTTPLLTLACVLWQLQLAWRNPAAPNPAAAIGEIVGRTLAARLPTGTLVASATAGSVPYFAPSLAFIDSLGLNDPHIARQSPATMPTALEALDGWTTVPGHLRGDGAYVLSRKPEVIMLGGANGDLLPWFLGDYQLVTSKTFQATYAPWRLLVVVPSPLHPWVADELDAETGHLPITLYVRRESPAWSVIAREGEALSPPWVAARPR
jgi:arabinofuranosyltransferase